MAIACLPQIPLAKGKLQQGNHNMALVITTLTIVTFLTTFNSSFQEYEKEARWTMNPLV
jgi:putative effector of murein hydrolase